MSVVTKKRKWNELEAGSTTVVVQGRRMYTFADVEANTMPLVIGPLTSTTMGNWYEEATKLYLPKHQLQTYQMLSDALQTVTTMAELRLLSERILQSKLRVPVNRPYEGDKNILWSLFQFTCVHERDSDKDEEKAIVCRIFDYIVARHPQLLTFATLWRLIQLQRRLYLIPRLFGVRPQMFQTELVDKPWMGPLSQAVETHANEALALLVDLPRQPTIAEVVTAIRLACLWKNPFALNCILGQNFLQGFNDGLSVTGILDVDDNSLYQLAMTVYSESDHKKFAPVQDGKSLADCAQFRRSLVNPNTYYNRDVPEGLYTLRANAIDRWIVFQREFFHLYASIHLCSVLHVPFANQSGLFLLVRQYLDWKISDDKST